MEIFLKAVQQPASLNRFELFCKSAWDRFGDKLLLAGCFLTALKLSLTYIAFGPAIVLWLFSNISEINKKIADYSWFIKPWSYFLLALVVSSLFGMFPFRSIYSLYSFLFYPVIIFAIADKFHKEKALLPLCSLLAGQFVAAIQSVIESSIKTKIPRFFLGEMTEAGQLALTIPIACGLAISAHRFSGLKLNKLLLIKTSLQISIICLLLIIAPRILHDSALSDWLSLLLITLTITSCFFSSAILSSKIHLNCNKWIELFLSNIRLLLIPALIAALVLNLKRGSWAGVTVSLLILMTIYSRKMLFIIIAFGALIVLSQEPVQQRLYQSSRDFFIPGGRADIWQVGIEISERFPLGTGFKSSKHLHQYSAEIPKELSHFHNNLINVLVEGGPLTLILFLYWLWSVFRYCYQTTDNHKLNPLLKASACAIVSWGVVGLSEYNLGDSEVMFVLYIILGSAAGIKCKELKRPDVV